MSCGVCRVVRVACVAWTSSGRLDPIRWSLFLVPRPRVNVAFRPSRGGAPQPVSDDCTAVVLTVRTDTHRTFICFYLFLFIICTILIIIILLLYYYYYIVNFFLVELIGCFFNDTAVRAALGRFVLLQRAVDLHLDRAALPLDHAPPRAASHQRPLQDRPRREIRQAWYDTHTHTH